MQLAPCCDPRLDRYIPFNVLGRVIPGSVLDLARQWEKGGMPGEIAQIERKLG
jgi:hypothetical protein